jgi:glyoxylase-like metal-dependent hydrolase (beta-lactamase superfamily II)
MRILRSVIALSIVALAGPAHAAGGMRVFTINDHLLAFYDGRPPAPAQPRQAANWADFGALDVGVATYVIHRGDQALVYDSFPYAEEARFVRDYLTKAGIRHFVLVNSHWHLDHVGGNAVYADSDRIATNKTIAILEAKKAGIETAAEWGPPAIKPFVLPNIGIDTDTTVHVGDIRVELRPIEIHSEDGLVIYLPGDRFLLAGDTLEDSATFVSEPDHVITHYRNLKRIGTWDIDRIFPNHGNPDVISQGGYRKTLIDATAGYLRQLVMHAHDPDYLKGTLEDYIGDSIQKGWVSIWWAYRDAHAQNLERMAAAWKDKALPDLPP